MSPDPKLIPPMVLESFQAYLKERRPPGSFVRTVLENDLMGAFRTSDETNLEALPHICAWLYWEMPTSLYGSKAKVKAHLNGKSETP